MKQFWLYFYSWKMTCIFRPLSHPSHAAQYLPFRFEEIHRGHIQPEQFDQLPQGSMQRIRQIQRLAECLGNRIQHHQFAIAPADFLLRPFPLCDIQQKSLVSGDVSPCVPHRDRRFHRGSHIPVLAPHFKLKIRYRVMFLQKPFETFAIGWIDIEFLRNVNGHQFIPVFIANDAHEGVVEIKKTPLRSGDEHTFLNVRNQRAILLFGALAVGDVFQHVHRAEFLAGRIGEGGIRSKEKSWQPWIRVVSFAGNTLAVRTVQIVHACTRQELCHTASCERVSFPAEKLAQSLIAPQNSELAVVNENRISNGVKCVSPLPLDCGYLFEQPHVLQRQTEEIRDVEEIRYLVRLKIHCLVRTYRDDPQRTFLPRQRQRDQFLQPDLRQPPPHLVSLSLLDGQEIVFLSQHFLGPRLRGLHAMVLLEIRRAKSHRSVDHQAGGFCLAFQQTYQAVRRAEAFH